MAKIKAFGDGSTVEYKSLKLTRYSRAMCGKFKMYFPHEPHLFDTYKQIVEALEMAWVDLDGNGRVHLNDEQLNTVEHYEDMAHTFLTDADYCGLPEGHEAVGELTPTISKLITMVRRLDEEREAE